MKSTAEQIINRVRRQIEQSRVKEANELAFRGLRWWPEEVRLWRLLGVSSGILGDHEAAKEAFAEALRIGCADHDVSNLLTSVLALRDIKFAVEILESQFSSLCPEAKHIAARSIAEAMRIVTIKFTMLPHEVQVFLKDNPAWVHFK